jgi:hypothetical protein
MFNSAFDHWGAKAEDYYPSPERAEIDAVNARIYETHNNGVYKFGFPSTQAAYKKSVTAVFETLDWLEHRLSQQRCLVGDAPTEADIRLFTTLVRFFPAYYGHFKYNRRALTDYPDLWDYTRALYQHPDIRQTVNFLQIKNHYYMSHPWLNPSGIVPVGPVRDFDASDPLSLWNSASVRRANFTLLKAHPVQPAHAAIPRPLRLPNHTGGRAPSARCCRTPHRLLIRQQAMPTTFHNDILANSPREWEPLA